ncbi:MAG: fumarylacetoacetase [Aquisalimonadaceae bacterium]
MKSLDETHDAGQKSWILSANVNSCDFPLQNLPFGVFRRHKSQESFRGGVAIGDEIVDLGAAVDTGLFSGDARIAAEAAATSTLNTFMSLGPAYRIALRQTLSALLRQGAARQEDMRACLVPQTEAEYALPATIGDFSDFYSSLHHATNVGALFRPDNPVLPNFKWLPVGYHGRSSSIFVSGKTFRRPSGQLKSPDTPAPEYRPSRRLDYEAELGIFVGRGNATGQPVDMDSAEEHVFGVSILNDWSARDIQAWEYQPLGPFLAKSFTTTVSPWIVTLEALAPFRSPWTRDPTDPQPLPHLLGSDTRERGAIDIHVEVLLQTARMRSDDIAPIKLSVSRFIDSYWTISQLITHQSSNGCNLCPGDLLGTGTLSGPERDSLACLLELSRGGQTPIALPNGEIRTFLEDGDTVIMRAYCERDGQVRIGFGQCVGTVLPAD